MQFLDCVFGSNLVVQVVSLALYVDADFVVGDVFNKFHNQYFLFLVYVCDCGGDAWADESVSAVLCDNEYCAAFEGNGVGVECDFFSNYYAAVESVVLKCALNGSCESNVILAGCDDDAVYFAVAYVGE